MSGILFVSGLFGVLATVVALELVRARWRAGDREVLQQVPAETSLDAAELEFLELRHIFDEANRQRQRHPSKRDHEYEIRLREEAVMRAERMAEALRVECPMPTIDRIGLG